MTGSAAFNSMFKFDIAALQWSDLSGSVLGSPPSSRASYGFVGAGAKLYVFGGNTCNYLAVTAGKQFSWEDG